MAYNRRIIFIVFYFMARQKSIITLQGEIDGISFYQTKDGYLARKKTSLSGDRVRTDPRFVRTRENAAEFTRAGQSAALVRRSLRSLYAGTADSRMTGRFNQAMMRVLKTDSVSLRGERDPANGELGLLQGFNFNRNTTLASTLYVEPRVEVDRAAGSCVITVPPFIPQKMVMLAEGATHYRFVAGLSLVNFAEDDHVVSTVASEDLPGNAVAQQEAELTINFEAGTTDALFVAFGIEFVQLVNGQQYPLISGGFNALQMIHAERGV